MTDEIACPQCTYHRTLLRQAYNVFDDICNPELRENITQGELERFSDEITARMLNLMSVIEEDFPDLKHKE